MRRPTRLGLAILAALLVIAGAYSAFWFAVAGRIADGLVDWARSARAEKTELSWQKITITGFPTAFRVHLASAVLRDEALAPSPELRIPVLTGSARPWDFSIWRLAAPEGFTGDIADGGGRAPARLIARTGDGVLVVSPENAWTLWLSLHETTFEAGARGRMESAHATVTVPPKAQSSDAKPTIAFGIEAKRINLPIAVGPLGDAIEELDIGATVRGEMPGGKLADALAAWRDSGGTIELDNLHLKWGGLGATATGTIALDQDLQPFGGLTGAIQGYDQILTTLVQTGYLRPSDAGLARIALTMLARGGADGRPEITTALTIRNGQVFLGPAKLGRVPHVTWQ
jgi:hypothetical protein